MSWLTLPKLPTHTRVSANALIRTAIFAARTGRGRQVVYTEPTELGAYGGYVVKQTAGHQLNQLHMDIWLELMQMSLPFAIDPKSHAVEVIFSIRQLIRALSAEDAKNARFTTGQMRQALKDLVRATFEITLPNGREFESSLLLARVADDLDDEKEQHGVLLNGTLFKLFAKDWSQIDSVQRKALAGKGLTNVLAQWLHAFYSSHREPMPVGLPKIQCICGRKDRDVSKFRKELTVALQLLAEKTGWACSIEDDIVKINRGLAKLKPIVGTVGAKTAKPAAAVVSKASRKVQTPENAVEMKGAEQAPFPSKQMDKPAKYAVSADGKATVKSSAGEIGPNSTGDELESFGANKLSTLPLSTLRDIMRPEERERYEQDMATWDENFLGKLTAQRRVEWAIIHIRRYRPSTNMDI